MKIRIFIAFLFFYNFSHAQEESLDGNAIGEGSISQSCGLEPLPGTGIINNGTCFDYGPTVQIGDAIRDLFGERIQYGITSNNSANIYTGDSGLTVDEIKQAIGDTTLPDGRKLIEIVTVIEGEIPFFNNFF